MLKSSVLHGGLLIALGGIFLYSLSLVPSNTEFSESLPAQTSMNNIRFKMSDAQTGTFDYQLLAPYAEDDGQGTLFLKQPFIHLFSKNYGSWKITAQEAYSKDSVQTILFKKSVSLSEHPKDNRSGIRITTDSLSVSLKNKTAETKDTVTLYQPPNQIMASGLQANFKENWIKLLSNARGYYVPSS